MTNDTAGTDLESPFLDEELRQVTPAPEDEGADFEGKGDAADEREVIVAEDCEGDLERDDEAASEGEGADFEGEDDVADEREVIVAEDCEGDLEGDDGALRLEAETDGALAEANGALAEGEDPRAGAGQLLIVDGEGAPLADGKYALYQADVTERGTLASGRAPLGRIDPARPFIVEVRDRACAIRVGAYLDPDNDAIQYGGTWFDWTIVRDDRQPGQRFWPHYQREMDGGTWTVDWFMQHEHITRRPIQIARPYLAKLGQVRIRATPVRIRVGPFVRYADHERAVIWLETVTPSMVRVRYRVSGASSGNESASHASTVRVGGRYFATVEIDGLEPDTFYDYTVELAPLPAIGPVPVTEPELRAAFPNLTPEVVKSMQAQCMSVALRNSEWLAFRTLRRTYDRTLRFATGSCRWYPDDTERGTRDHPPKSWRPDMLAKLGDWLRAHEADRKAAWPHFLFFGGDQIYTDEIGTDHSAQLLRARIASRLPGPADPAASPRDKLVDGAWAGRFAHRYHAYNEFGAKQLEALRTSLAKLDDIHRRYPDIKGIAKEYPGADPAQKLRDRYTTLKNKRELGGAHGEADDERKAREAVELLPVVHGLETSAEPLRILMEHWAAASDASVRGNPMRRRFLCQNYLLWAIPDFPQQAPTITEGGGATVVRRLDGRAYPSADDGRHAADFAEIAYLYERAWAVSPHVRRLFAHVPTFLMFDDHEVTDDWNFDLTWVRLLHNRRDGFRMWPKTMTDALAAYWVYQGWCNRAPSQWATPVDPQRKVDPQQRGDPRANCLARSQRAGVDALPELRRLIHRACFALPPPPQDPKAPDRKAHYQTGTSLDWHYRLPFDPPFLVPDCRSRKLLAAGDEKLRVIDHGSSNAPQSRTIDDAQLEWMRRILVDEWRGGPVAFVAPSTPLLLQQKVMAFMRAPEVAAAAQQGKKELATIAAFAAALFNSTKLGIATDALLRVFRRSNDLEHMIRDRSWRDLWSIVAAMQKSRSPVKTLVLVSGDVHHSYNMTANLSGRGRPLPELLQITCSGLQTTIRKTFARTLGEQLGSLPFDVGSYQLVPGFVQKRGRGGPDLVLYENAVAIVDVTIGTEVGVVVTYLAGQDEHIYRYTSGAAYMKGGIPAVIAP